ncbi:MAG: nuclear transport factor 2 family protein [Gilvibacter sp.]
MYRVLIILCLLIGSNQAMQAQVAKDSPSHQLIVKNDSMLFERSFNNCEMEVLEQLLSEDLEFYHDISGILLTKRAFIDNFKNGICGNSSFKARRELIKGSIKVYELKDNNKVYGLIQQGEHRFYESNNAAPEVAGSIAKFTHLWILEDDGVYRLKRALSYDHKMPTKK